MSQKETLKSMIGHLINKNDSAAELDLHKYLAVKMQESMNGHKGDMMTESTNSVVMQGKYAMATFTGDMDTTWFPHEVKTIEIPLSMIEKYKDEIVKALNDDGDTNGYQGQDYYDDFIKYTSTNNHSVGGNAYLEIYDLSGLTDKEAHKFIGSCERELDTVGSICVDCMHGITVDDIVKVAQKFIGH